MGLEVFSWRIKGLLQDPNALCAGEDKVDESPMPCLRPVYVIDEKVKPFGRRGQSFLPAVMEEREKKLMAVLECASPEEIVHAVRNLQNRVVMVQAMLKKRGIETPT